MSGVIGRAGSKSGVIGIADGSMTLIYKSTNPNTTSEYTESVFSGTYTVYTLVIGAYIGATDGEEVYFRWLSSGQTEATGSYYDGVHHGAELTNSGSISTGEARGTWHQNVFHFWPGGGFPSNEANEGGIWGQFTIHDPYSSTKMTKMQGTCGMRRTAHTKVMSSMFHGIYGSAQRHTGFRIFFGAGGVAHKRLWIYGHNA